MACSMVSTSPGLAAGAVGAAGAAACGVVACGVAACGVAARASALGDVDCASVNVPVSAIMSVLRMIFFMPKNVAPDEAELPEMQLIAQFEIKNFKFKCFVLTFYLGDRHTYVECQPETTKNALHSYRERSIC